MFWRANEKQKQNERSDTMSKANVKVVEGFVDQIINHKQFERLTEFCTEDCILHATPYVGLGVNFDDTSGEKLILCDIAPNGPADGPLQLGDELIHVQDGEHIWESFDDLRKGYWARGVVDTEIHLTVRRRGSLITIPLRRSRIDAFDMKASETFSAANPYWTKYWPDVKMEIREVFGSGDLVACYAVNSGTNMEYEHSAVWGEIDLFRLKGNRINEAWMIDDAYSMYRQLGYQITEPIREPV
jgi:predicted SnoaL-like aldol condensation-catalyzing enzyme